MEQQTVQKIKHRAQGTLAGFIIGVPFLTISTFFGLDTKASMAITEARYNISVAMAPAKASAWDKTVAFFTPGD